jgi:membrane-associated phospholipid phosphatase
VTIVTSPDLVSDADARQVVPGRRAVIVAIVVLLLVVADIHFSGPLDHLDHRVAVRMNDWDLRRHTWDRRLFTIGLFFGQRGVVLPGAVLVAGWLSWRTHTAEPLVRLACAVLCLALVVYGFKLGLARNAPIQDAEHVPAGHGASFPSGHMANAVLLWGLSDWAVRHWRSPVLLRRADRTGRCIAPVAIPVAMTLLNYHWLSDFVGGAAIGVVLLALAVHPRLLDVSLWIERRWSRRPPLRLT